MAATQGRAGFSLVELIIVIAALAILAALVIPQFSSATHTVKVKAAAVTLTDTRKAIGLYAFEHGGKFPATAALKASLTQSSREDGTLDPAGKLGPYLSDKPVNPWNRLDAIHEVAHPTPAVAVALVEKAATVGWLNHPAGGQIAMPGFDDAQQVYHGPGR